VKEMLIFTIDAIFTQDKKSPELHPQQIPREPSIYGHAKVSSSISEKLASYFAFRCLRLAIFALKLLCLLIPFQDSQS
jgi:hypothetical protein